MRGRSFIWVFSTLILVVMTFVSTNEGSSLKTEGAHCAYFTELRYPTTAFQGENSTFRLTVFNKNCKTNGIDTAYFFFKFYLNDDLWWEENEIWKCSENSSVTRLYFISSWDTIKPIIYDLRIELYLYERNSSELQDVVSFPISIAVRLAPSDLTIFSFQSVCLIGIFLLGFYMLILGPIKIYSMSKDRASAVHHQSRVGIQFFAFLYLFVFASWQTLNTLFYGFFSLEQFGKLVKLTAQIVYITLFILLIRKDGPFRKYGYLWPEETRRYFVVSFLLAVVYSVIVIFIPGSTSYNVFPSAVHTGVFLTILLAFATSFLSEIIFRGYLQNKLTEMIGLPQALITTSMMFVLFTVPLLPFNLSNLFPEFLSLFALGLFLGILFYRTKTLLCPILFYFTVLTFKALTPIEAVASENVRLFSVFFALTVSLLLLGLLTVRKNGQHQTESETTFDDFIDNLKNEH